MITYYDLENKEKKKYEKEFKKTPVGKEINHRKNNNRSINVIY